MINELGNYFSVYFASMIKFLGGPAIGTAVGLSHLEIVVFTVLGMMTTVLIMTFLGKKIREICIKKIRKKGTGNLQKVIAGLFTYGVTMGF